MTGPPPLLLHSLSLGESSRAVSLPPGTSLKRALEPAVFGAGNRNHASNQHGNTAIMRGMRNSGSETPVSSSDGSTAGGEAGDPIARLFAAMRPDLLRFAHWLARDRAIAEDIVQESLLRAWRSRDALKDQAAARPWLLTIVRREHARLYERKRLELVALDDGIEPEGMPSPPGPDSEIDSLRGAILKLPLEYREPLIMQVLGGFSTAEIAEELSLSSTAVLTRLFRARNKLRALYGLTPAPDDVEGEGVA